MEWNADDYETSHHMNLEFKPLCTEEQLAGISSEDVSAWIEGVKADIPLLSNTLHKFELHKKAHETPGDIVIRDPDQGFWRSPLGPKHLPQWQTQVERGEVLGTWESFATFVLGKKAISRGVGWVDFFRTGRREQYRYIKLVYKDGDPTPAQKRKVGYRKEFWAKRAKGKDTADEPTAAPPPASEGKRPVSPSLLNFKCNEPVVGVPITPVEKPSKKSKTLKGRDPNLWKPPNAVFQQARFAGTCTPLKKYLLKQHLWKTQGTAHWNAIGEWCKTKEGRKYLQTCGIDPQGVTLDHIRDKNHTPIHHAMNCYFMPGGANAHFNNRSDDEKEAYVGSMAADVSKAFVKWYIEKANTLTIDCSKFDYSSALMK